MKIKALKAAFPNTIPILASFLFLGISYGIYMSTQGFSFVYPMVMAAVIFGGSLEFVCVEMLLSPFAPLSVIVMALMIQARHIFYGIAMLGKYEGTGWKKFYLIFGLCDETFTVNYYSKIPEDVDRGWFMFFVTLLNQFYWVAGATIGGLVGGLFTFDTSGISFVMTAMFVVIFLEQWLKEKSHLSATIGIGASLICLIVFGADGFMLPAMAAIILALVALKKPILRMDGAIDGNPQQTARHSDDLHETACRSDDLHETARRSDNPHETARRSDNPHETACRSDDLHETARRSDNPHETACRSDNPHETACRSDNPHETACRSDDSDAQGGQL